MTTYDEYYYDDSSGSGAKLLPPARLTQKQAAIISAYTGVLCGPFSDLHEYAERILGRPIWMHEMGTERIAEQIKKAAEEDFKAICYEVQKRGNDR